MRQVSAPMMEDELLRRWGKEMEWAFLEEITQQPIDVDFDQQLDGFDWLPADRR